MIDSSILTLIISFNLKQKKDFLVSKSMFKKQGNSKVIEIKIVQKMCTAHNRSKNLMDLSNDWKDNFISPQC